MKNIGTDHTYYLLRVLPPSMEQEMDVHVSIVPKEDHCEPRVRHFALKHWGVEHLSGKICYGNPEGDVLKIENFSIVELVPKEPCAVY